MDGFASHLPILNLCLSKTKGISIEVGIGWYSTPLIQAYGGISVELDSTDWDTNKLEKVYTIYKEIDLSRKYSVAFIDSYPESSRVPIVNKLKNNADLFVLHDSNPDWEPAYNYKLLQFSFKYNFTHFYPNTMVCSNTRLPWLEEFLLKFKS